MARAAKKELTVEEKLAQALVPEEERPYPVPGNWCWAHLGEISEIIMGQSPKGTATTDDSAYMPLIGGAADMGDLYPKASRYTKVPTKISRKGDVILCIRATLGRPIFSDDEYCLGRGVAAIRSSLLTKELLRYGLICFEQYLYDNATGSTFEQISSSVLNRMPFPLPPLAEQSRIVNIIECLFADLDKAKEKLQSVLEGFAQRRMAILHRAFTGELTAKWRKENGIRDDSWKDGSFGDVLDEIKYGTSAKSNYTNHGVAVLRIPNIGNGMIDYSDMKYLEHVEVPETDLIKTDDILMVRSNGSRDIVGKAAIVSMCRGAMTYASFLIRLRCNRKRMCPSYAVKLLASPDTRNQFLNKAKSSAGIHNVNTKEIKSVKIKIPLISEQKEIVRLLDDLFSQESQSKAVVESVLADIDLIKKSILSRAFRGALGTNDSNDESALELLRATLQ